MMNGDTFIGSLMIRIIMCTLPKCQLNPTYMSSRFPNKALNVKINRTGAMSVNRV